jgi:hypothetical protein
MTTASRLRDLWLRYVEIKSADPAVHAQFMAPGDFPADVARLFLRYRDRGRGKTNETRIKRLGTGLMRRLMQQALGADTERFASPLNVPAACGPITHALRKTGLSGQPTTHTRSLSQVGARVGRDSTETSPKSTGTLILLPASRTAPYTRYLNHDLVVRVATIPARAVGARLHSDTHFGDPRP